MKKMNHLLPRNAEDFIIDSFCYLVGIIVIICMFYPFYYILILAFNDGIDAVKGGIYFWPREFTLQNFYSFFIDKTWSNALVVTIFRTLIGTMGTVIVTCVVSYGLSFRQLLFRKFYMNVIVICMYFSGGIIPYFIVLRSLGLTNNFLVYIIPNLLNLFFVIVGISFFQQIPEELRESAIIDGAPEIVVFFKIILPVSMPLIATVALFSGVGHWNSWFDSVFFVRSNNLRTLGYVLMKVINKNSVTTGAAVQMLNKPVTSKSIQMAAMVVTVGPIICIYPFLQKYFIKGAMIGAVKG